MSQTPPTPPSVPPAPGYGAPVPPGDGYGNGYGNATPPYGAQPGGSYSPVQEPRYNVLAIVSFVSAFFLSLVAVITGHMALGQIKRTAEKGRGLAIAGLVLGYAGIVGGIITIIALVVMAIAGIGLFATIATNYDSDDYSYTSDPFSSTAVPDSLGGDLTFEAGNDLDATTVAQFADPFIIDSEWTVASPDDGNGNWSYLDPSGLCTVSFHQGGLGDTVPVTAGDDRATTTSFLAVVLDTDDSTIAGKATDSTISYNFEDAGLVDTLLMQGTDADGSNWKLAGRAFGELGSGLYVDVTCKSGGDLESVYDTVTTKAAITVF
ncbi:DUF4190 domain-containing protein [Agreia sp. Leaf283]|uniref:DUF4190 domain-containing protein n=1 Tax=Agreia sp. Leaf283 TaxID=1736321 RepID=UPI000AD34E82|nr:DUF4190 domain-containing protein [Agreia sp. Leaf283]